MPGVTRHPVQLVARLAGQARHDKPLCNGKRLGNNRT